MKTYIYVIHMPCPTGFVKIGISDNPEKRLASMQTANPYQLRLARRFGPFERDRAMQLEGRLHRIFEKDHVRGEWFGASPDTIAHALTTVSRFTNARFEEFMECLRELMVKA